MRDARIQMSLAALEAGIAFNNSSVTLVHGMSRLIGRCFMFPMEIQRNASTDVQYAAEGARQRFGMQ